MQERLRGNRVRWALRSENSDTQVSQIRRDLGHRLIGVPASKENSMIDLSTKYLGMKLASPLVVSASPLSRDIDGICRLEDAGASAVVLYSLFEEQLRQEEADLNYHLNAGTESFAESITFFPQASEFHTGPEGYLKHIRKCKAAVKIPIIASLNGSTLGGWTKFAAEIEKAGADAIECNIYSIATDPMLSGA